MKLAHVVVEEARLVGLELRGLGTYMYSVVSVTISTKIFANILWLQHVLFQSINDEIDHTHFTVSTEPRHQKVWSANEAKS